jgi:superfamily II DNA or RNA helicase
MTDPRNKWQDEAVSVFEQTSNDFLVTACPGSGKTMMGLKAASRGLKSGQFNRIIVVVTLRHLKNQWATCASAMGLDLQENFENADGNLVRDSHGVVTTYQQIASFPDLWRKIASERQTLVIFDEIHHAADDDHSSWGPAIKHAFENVDCRLLLSGTPFRTNGLAIPYVQYDSSGFSISDSKMGYGQAVREGIVRDVSFLCHGGSGEWLSRDRRGEADSASVTEQDKSKLLTALYDPQGQWIRSILQAANDELTDKRDEFPRAQGLVVASSRGHVKEYAKILADICGEAVPYVISDDEVNRDTSRIINDFKEGDARWIVANHIISEGVDIPNLTVGVYASKVMTELYFQQFIGRFVRLTDPDVTSRIFIPSVTPLTEYAARIEDDIAVALKEREEEVRQRVRNEQLEFEIPDIQVLDSSKARLENITKGGSVTHADRLAEAEKARMGPNWPGAHRKMALEDVAQIMDALQPVHGSGFTAPVPVAPEPRRESVDDLRRVLKKRVNALVAELAQQSDDHKRIHSGLNTTFRDKLAHASVATLEGRLQRLLAMKEHRNGR